MAHTSKQQQAWEAYCENFSGEGGNLHHAFTHGYMAAELNSAIAESLKVLRPYIESCIDKTLKMEDDPAQQDLAIIDAAIAKAQGE
jgi:hypothetical protein